MKYQEIITRVRNIAGDTAVLQFSNQMVIDWINDAVREVVIDNALLQKTATSNLVVGDTTYSLPTDIFKLHSITVNGEKIKVFTQNEHQELGAGPGGTPTENGFPIQAYVWATELNLVPAPDDTYELKIYYTYDPGNYVIDDLVNDEPPIHQSYHARIVTYCLAQVALLDEDTYRYNGLIADFRAGVSELKSLNQEEDQYPFISVASRDMGMDFDSTW